MTTDLAAKRQQRWTALRMRVKTNIIGMWCLAADLRTIREECLYEDDYDSFEAYLSQEVGIGRSHAYRIIDAVEVRDKLSPMGDTTPEILAIDKERQLRELVGVPDSQLADVAEKAAVMASDASKPITAHIIREARKSVLGPPESLAGHTPSAALETDKSAENAREAIPKLCDKLYNALGTLGYGRQYRDILEEMKKCAGN